MPKAQQGTAFDLEIEEKDGSFVLTFAGEPVKTASGSVVTHKSADLLQHMIDEFDQEGSIVVRNGVIEKPKQFSAYALYNIQKEYVELYREELYTQFAAELCKDGMLYRSAGPEQIDQLARWTPVLTFLENLGHQLPSLIGPFFDDPSFYRDEAEYHEAKEYSTPSSEFTEALSDAYRSLSAAQRTVAMFLHAIHDGVVLYPIVLAEGKCTPNEYASGVMASHGIITGVFGDVTKGAHRKTFERLKNDARTALEYLSFLDNELERIRKSIEAGESKTREFKSTLRWNIKAGRDDDALTHSCLKTISAFLNSDGGELFIGVGDDGSIVGIELDHFPTADKFQLHLMNLVKEYIGEASATLVTPSMVALGGKEICRVACGKTPVDRPVFLKFKRGDEEFFVRTGPSTTKLPPSEIHKFIAGQRSTSEKIPM